MNRNIFVPIVILVLSAVIPKAFAGVFEVRSKTAEPRLKSGIKIGLLADTQFQTLKSDQYVKLYKTKKSDKTIPVTLRPPALSAASPFMLKTFLDNLIKEEEPDVIFYLGDGANNGCTDEYAQVIDILFQYRKAYSIPIFITIGNHDYLGAGNTSRDKQRRELCADRGQVNPPLTKSNLLDTIHFFNVTSYTQYIRGISKYGDTGFIDSYEKMQGVKMSAHKRQDQQIFLATRIFLDGNEFVIIDTSDYGDKGTLPAVGSLQGLGTMGWISTKRKGSQGHWLQTHRVSKVVPNNRIFLSHYPTKDIGPVAGALGTSEVLDRMSRSFLPKPAKGTVWISAHTHNQPTVRSVNVMLTNSSYFTFQELNIGSTTDYGDKSNLKTLTEYQPYSVVLNIPKDDNENGNFYFKKITLNTEKCVPVLAKLNKLTTTNLEKIIDSSSIYTQCGMDCSYRKEEWKASYNEKARQNLNKVINLLINEPSAVDINVAESCIGLQSSFFEKYDEML